MRIGITGTQNVGKSTVIEDMLSRWGMYGTPERTYRDLIKERGLPINQETTPETQSALMDFICDQVMSAPKDLNVIFDRTPYDCLVYSIYQNYKGVEGFTDEFIETQILLAKEASSFLDIIFYIPIVEKHDIAIVNDGLRDTDPEYRKEIDNLFSAIFETYHTGSEVFFKKDDRPAVIEIFGTPEERIEMIKLYITESGKPYGEEDSLLSDEIVVPDEFRAQVEA
jgi:hypothetical protein